MHDVPGWFRRWRSMMSEKSVIDGAHSRRGRSVHRVRAMTWRTSPGSRGRGSQLPMWSSAATTVDGILARPGSVATTTTIDGGSASDSRRVSEMVYERGASGAHSLSGGRSSLSPVPSSLPSSSRARFRVRGDSSALDANGLACCPWVG